MAHEPDGALIYLALELTPAQYDTWQRLDTRQLVYDEDTQAMLDELDLTFVREIIGVDAPSAGDALAKLREMGFSIGEDEVASVSESPGDSGQPHWTFDCYGRAGKDGTMKAVLDAYLASDEVTAAHIEYRDGLSLEAFGPGYQGWETAFEVMLYCVAAAAQAGGSGHAGVLAIGQAAYDGGGMLGASAAAGEMSSHYEPELQDLVDEVLDEYLPGEVCDRIVARLS